MPESQLSKDLTKKFEEDLNLLLKRTMDIMQTAGLSNSQIFTNISQILLHMLAAILAFSSDPAAPYGIFGNILEMQIKEYRKRL